MASRRSCTTLVCMLCFACRTTLASERAKESVLTQHVTAALRRSEFFPGLGWLMTKRLWEELGPKWPAGFWDDWLREPEQRLGRVCLASHSLS